MVNKVDGNNYYVYTKQKKIDVSDTGEKFNLGYQKNEMPPEAKDKKEVSDQEKQHQTQRLGVRLELSSSGRDAGTDRHRPAQTVKTPGEGASMQVPLLETIQTYIRAAITAVQEFFHNIWNGQPQDDVSQDVQLSEDISQNVQLLEDVSQNVPEAGDVMQSAASEASQETSEIIDTPDQISVPVMEEERRNREIQQSLRDGDMEQVIRLLTENGKRTAARNSTLLTSYDKNGRVVEPNASDRERTLHGDRNTWKL